MFNVHIPPGQTRRFEKLPIVWLHTLNVAFNSAPILFKNDVVACASDGTMASYQQNFGMRNWIHNNGHSVIAPLGVMDHFVYLASSDFAVTASTFATARTLALSVGIPGLSATGSLFDGSPRLLGRRRPDESRQQVRRAAMDERFNAPSRRRFERAHLRR